ncbi:hypothetical protein EVAR_11955_1 [Eumeta japonica]|uniref:Uncharacterized protein n=1 Tax=Eumeta variegata TaxID=151549 RepID=A0A4C1U692_EUMVA|nr:hypothetical protein EVAR_11955_1 [Eumeta japonica]
MSKEKSRFNVGSGQESGARPGSGPRADRRVCNKKERGGVVIATLGELHAFDRVPLAPRPDCVDHVLPQVPLGSTENCVISTAHIPPSRSADTYDVHLNSLSDLNSTRADTQTHSRCRSGRHSSTWTLVPLTSPASGNADDGVGGGSDSRGSARARPECG